MEAERGGVCVIRLPDPEHGQKQVVDILRSMGTFIPYFVRIGAMASTFSAAVPSAKMTL